VLHLNSLTNICKYAGIAGYLAGIPIIWFVREDPLGKKSQKTGILAKNALYKNCFR